MEDRPWFSNYDPDVPQSLEFPQTPLTEFLRESGRKHPDAPCTVFKGQKITFSEMDQLTDRLAAGLVDLGVTKGQPVGVFMPNTPQFVMAFYAILKAGGVVVATNPLYSPREMEHQLNDSGVEIMLVMSNFYESIKKVQPKTKVRKLIVTNIKETLPSLLAFLFTLTREKKDGHRVELAEGDIWLQDLLKKYATADPPMVDLGPEDVALFQYSGGTTGLSKAAVATHGNLVANTHQIVSWMNPEEGREIMLMAIPLFHVYGLVAGMSFAIKTGSAMIMVPNPRDLDDVLGNIQKYRPTIFPGVPTLYNALNNHPDVASGKYDLSSITACISGSAPLLRETKDRFEELTGGKLVEGYGLSEAPTATHCNPIYGENRAGSIGLPLPGIDSRIVSLEDGVTVLGPGEEGELVIQGPNVMRGYHNMPTETKNTIREGWLYTGDIAKMDDGGFFYIVDRKKELIKPGGFQVWPREVEEVIADHPSVMEVGVAGVPDAYRGETVKAWVVLQPGATLTAEQLREHCKENLAAYKVPTEIEFREELPKTTVGKILRRELVREHMESVSEGA